LQSSGSGSRNTPAATGSLAGDAPPRLVEAVNEFLARLDEGKPVDRCEFLKRYADVADDLEKCLEGLEFIRRASPRFSEPAAGHSMSTIAAEQPVGQPVGDFRIVREIGRGGMGIVYEALQLSLNRRVALKILPFAAALDARALAWFRQESLAAAQLDHPHIVDVYAVGCDRGMHYYAMRYIEGQSLEQIIAEMRLTSGSSSREVQPSDFAGDVDRLARGGASDAVRSQAKPGNEAPTVPAKKAPLSTDRTTNRPEYYRGVARLGAQAAEALDYAHEHGVLHRDIKPANLILDSEGRVWVTDFGLAQIEIDAGLTMTGDIVGTLRYMSPEQALSERGLVDQRTDVYSLGLALYELLTLKPAFGDASRHELLHRISTDDPIPPRRVDPRIPAELETIVQKATEKEAASRYATAHDLADDLRRFLDEQPIKARPPTPFGRLCKWARRNRGLVRSSALLAVVAAISLTIAAFLIDHAHYQTRLEQQARGADKKIADAAQENLDAHRYVTSYVNNVNLAVNNVNLPDRAPQIDALSTARRYLEACVPATGQGDLRSIEWRFLQAMTRPPPPPLYAHTGPAMCSSFSPDGKMLATGGRDGIRVWDLGVGTLLGPLSQNDGGATDVCFSPGGQWLASADADQTVRVRSTTEWHVLRAIRHAGPVFALAFTPDERLLAVAEEQLELPRPGEPHHDVVRLWNTATWEEAGVLRNHTDQLRSISISSDGTRLASVGFDGAACVYELPSGRLLHKMIHHDASGKVVGINAVAFAHRPPELATAGRDGLVWLWNRSDGSPKARFQVSEMHLDSIAYSRDDSAIAVSGEDNQVHVWETGRERMYSPTVHFRMGDRVWSVRFRDTDELFATSDDGEVRRWNRLRTPDRIRISGIAGSHHPRVALTPDGKYVVVLSGELFVVDVANTSSRITLAPGSEGITAVAVSPDGKTLAVADAECQLTFWDVAGWRKGTSWRIPANNVACLSFIANGRLLAAYAPGGSVFYFDTSTHTIVKRAAIQSDNEYTPPSVICLGPAAESDEVFGTTHDLEIWAAGKPIWRQPGRGPNLFWTTVAWSPDGRRIAASAADSSIHIWSAGVRDQDIVFAGDGRHTDNLVFSPDGRTLAGAGSKSRINLWNIATGRLLMTLETGHEKITSSGISANGRALAVGGIDRAGRPEVIVWLADSD